MTLSNIKKTYLKDRATLIKEGSKPLENEVDDFLMWCAANKIVASDETALFETVFPAETFSWADASDADRMNSYINFWSKNETMSILNGYIDQHREGTITTNNFIVNLKSILPSLEKEENSILTKLKEAEEETLH